MKSTALIAPLPLLTSRSRSKPLSPASTRARRPASIPFSYGSGRVVLFSRRGREYAGVGSLVSAAAATGEGAGGGSEAILLSVQGMMYDGCAASVKWILESQGSASAPSMHRREMVSTCKSSLSKQQKKRLDTAVMLVSWMLWKERNARVFSNAELTVNLLLQEIYSEGNLVPSWR
ncbi:hypothetical protein C2845_PM03G13260 [Panicum miliaceum]|uniref:Uncharacterized protein n=1 Tax=Panicum miliaceum TaxID=4540 RepID=A0A3L6TD26_PANMI|nr:hypothetical protein C2845_PM03G13260 [Panicum miliaceum]